MATKAEFSHALSSTFMFSKSGGKCTNVQFIVWKKGLLHILTASHTALLCGSPSDPPTLQTQSVVKCDQRDEERLLFHIVHPPTSGKMGVKGDWRDAVPAMARGWEETRSGITDRLSWESRLTMGFTKGLKLERVIPHIQNLEPKPRLRRRQQVFCHSGIRDLDLAL